MKVSPIDPILKLDETNRHNIHSINSASNEWNWIVRNYRCGGHPLSLLQCLLAIFFQHCEYSGFTHHACKSFLYKTPGLSVASSGERITRDIDFYKKVGEVELCIVCLLRY